MPENSTPAAPPDGDFFVVEDLHKSFGTQDVLSGASLKVRRGETMVIIGASGGGKSVFLKHLNGLLRADSGSVSVDGTDITALRERDLGEVSLLGNDKTLVRTIEPRRDRGRDS